MPDPTFNADAVRQVIQNVLRRKPMENPSFSKEVILPALFGANPGIKALSRSRRIRDEKAMQDTLRSVLGLPGGTPTTSMQPIKEPPIQTTPPSGTAAGGTLFPEPTLETPEPPPVADAPLGAIHKSLRSITLPMPGGGSITLAPPIEADALITYKDHLDRFSQTMPRDTASMEALYSTAIDTGFVLPADILERFDFSPEKQASMMRSQFIGLVPTEGVEGAREALSKLYPDIPQATWDATYSDSYNINRLVLQTADWFRVMVQRDTQLTGSALEAEVELRAARASSNMLGGWTPTPAEAERVRPQAMQIKDIPDKDIKQEWINAGFTLNDYVPQPEGPRRAPPPTMAQAAQAVEDREATQAGIRAMRVEEAKAASLAREMEPMVNEIADMAITLNSVEGLARFWHGAKLKGLSYIQGGGPLLTLPDGTQEYTGTLAADYVDVIETYLAKFARSGGERGVLTEQDVDRAKKNFSPLGTSKSLTARKTRRMRKHIREIAARPDGWARGKPGAFADGAAAEAYVNRQASAFRQTLLGEAAPPADESKQFDEMLKAIPVKKE